MEKELKILEALIEEEKKGKDVRESMSEFMRRMQSNEDDDEEENNDPTKATHMHSNHSDSKGDIQTLIRDPKNRSWLFITIFLVMFTLRVIHLFLSRRDQHHSIQGQGLAFAHTSSSSRDFVDYNLAQQVILDVNIEEDHEEL